MGKSCTEALEIISADADLQQTMADEGMLVINVSSSSDSQQQGVLSQCETASESFSCETTCMASRASLHDEAAANGMGAARYSVYLQIAQIDPSVTVEQCQDMSMRQLRDLLAQVQAQANAAGNSENSGNLASSNGEDGTDTGAASSSADVSGAADTTDTATSSTADATALSEEAGSGHGMGKGMGGGMGHGAGRGQGNGSGHGGMGMGMGRATAWVTEAAWAWVRRDRARPTVPPGRSATSYDGRQTAPRARASGLRPTRRPTPSGTSSPRSCPCRAGRSERRWYRATPRSGRSP